MPGVGRRSFERDDQFMKPLSLQRTHGFTRVELVVVISVIAVFLLMLIPGFSAMKAKNRRSVCLRNLHLIGMAYRVWYGYSGDGYPASTSIKTGGWHELLQKPNQGPMCWTNYALMANDLGQDPKVLVCPADVRRAAASFTNGGMNNKDGRGVFKDNTTLSYFVGPDSSDYYPASILGGDRNLGPGNVPHDDYGYSPANGQGNDVIINGPVCWSLKMHSAGNPAGLGNIMLGDGSRQTTSSATFNTGLLTTALNDSSNHAGIRLIFP